MNKAVYAYYSKPFGSIDIRKAPSYWVLSYVEYIMLAFSVMQSNKYFGSTELVCDKFGKKILIDEFKLPFTHVKVDLDYCELKPRFWAAGKIHAYTKSQDEPFIMVDNDAGFYTEPKSEWLDEPYLCQQTHTDKGTRVGLIIKDMCNSTRDVFPFDIFHQFKNNLIGGNAGVVVLNDMELKKEFEDYTWALMNNSYFDGILRKSHHLNPYKALRIWNVVVEENLLYLLYLRKYGKKPKTILKDDGYMAKKNVSGVGYYHVWGDKKNHKIIKEYEQTVINLIPKDIKERIYNYYGIS